MPKNTAEADKVVYSAADTGFISQNVYLFCASEGLSTVVRGMIDRPELAKAMGLRDDQRIVLSQTVGYPR
jgi:nitroreductase